MKKRESIVTCVAAVTCVYTIAAWGQVADRSSDPVESGFLIVDGHAVDVPYVFRSEDDVVFVNDIELDPASLSFRYHEADGRGWNRFNQPRGFSGRFAGPPGWRNPWRRVADELEAGAIVVIQSNEQAVLVDSHDESVKLLKLLCDEEARREVADGSLSWLPARVDKGQWREWISAFEPTEQFLTRAQAYLDEMATIERINMAEVNAVRRLDASAYPLTALGMLLVVLATGHLLSHRPDAAAGKAAADYSPETNRLVCRSLVFVFLLSGLDLIWTVLVSQTGQMKELNPFGSRFIENPEQLILFKLAATTLAVGLLFAVRRSPFAQRASWWMCLVCTLLIARWLTFNSMHVT